MQDAPHGPDVGREGVGAAAPHLGADVVRRAHQLASEDVVQQLTDAQVPNLQQPPLCDEQVLYMGRKGPCVGSGCTGWSLDPAVPCGPSGIVAQNKCSADCWPRAPCTRKEVHLPSTHASKYMPDQLYQTAANHWHSPWTSSGTNDRADTYWHANPPAPSWPHMRLEVPVQHSVLVQVLHTQRQLQEVAPHLPLRQQLMPPLPLPAAATVRRRQRLRGRVAGPNAACQKRVVGKAATTEDTSITVEAGSTAVGRRQPQKINSSAEQALTLAACRGRR